MKLTIEHLAAYLPHKLKVYDLFTSDYMTLHSVSNAPYEPIGIIRNVIHKRQISEIKPLLHPLSDITKPITHNGETFVPIDYFEIGDGENYSKEYDHGNIKLIRSLESLAVNGFVNDINYLPYEVVKKLCEWHFDIFNLIPNNLAVDINTVKI